MAKKNVQKQRSTTADTRKIGERLRAARIAADMSQGTLGDELGLSFQQVQKYEKGANRIPAERLNKIAGLLNTTVNALLGRGADDQPLEEDQALIALMGTRDGQRLIRGFQALGAVQRTAFVYLIEVITDHRVI